MSDAHPQHDPPYPGPPEQAPLGGHELFTTLWQAISRVGLFGVGTVLVFTGDTDIQVTAGSGLMLASAGLALAKGLK